MASQDLPWYVLYTKPRNEKKVAQRLSEAGYNVYCPLQKVRRQWSDRTKVLEEPLFKSYLFIQIEDSRRDEVFSFRDCALFVLVASSCTGTSSRNQHHPKVVGDYNHEDIDISISIQENLCESLRSVCWRRSSAAGSQQTQGRRTAQRTGIQLSLSLSNNDLLAL